jgi:hypothetical protein
VPKSKRKGELEKKNQESNGLLLKFLKINEDEVLTTKISVR